jgi:hypothetical protein
MARLLGAREISAPEGKISLEITYAVGSDVRYLILAFDDMQGLAPDAIRALAQARADADSGLPGNTGDRDDIVPTMKSLPGWATWTAVEAEAWIETNVTSLATAKTALGAMAKALIYLRDMAVDK